MSWAPALMLALLPLIAAGLGLYIHDYLRKRPRRNRYRNDALPAPRPDCVVGNWGRGSTPGIH